MDSCFNNTRINHVQNNTVQDNLGWPEDLNPVLSPDITLQAREEIQQWDSYKTTPLHALDGLAGRLGLGGIYCKDEDTRFGLGSFKALGGANEVLCLLKQELSKRTGNDVSFAAIRNGEFAEMAKNITVATATDGNHGRSVAWGAQQFGCPCKIYIHAEVSAERKTAMEAFGAEVIRVTGNYDDSVHQADTDAKANDWFIVSDTSYEGYIDLPRYVMAGYTLMVEEALTQLPPGTAPTHVFVQGGCGGLAGAVFAHVWQTLGENKPRFVVVEPVPADCLFQSAVNSKPTDVYITEESLMAGLSCGEVSILGWNIIGRCAEHFLSMNDDLVGPTMRMLAEGIEGAAPIVAGESGVAGLAALIAVMQQGEHDKTLGLNANSQVLLFSTEGATDPEIYEQLVGRPANSVV